MRPHEWIKHARTAAGLTQAELAERMGVTRTVALKAENGEHTPQLARLIRVAEATGQGATIYVYPSGVVDVVPLSVTGTPAPERANKRKR